MSLLDSMESFGGQARSEREPQIVEAGRVYQDLDAWTKGLIDEFIQANPMSGRSELLPGSENSNSEEVKSAKFAPLLIPSDMRVLELHAGSFTDALHCTLLTCSLGFEYPPVPEDEPTSHPYLRYAISRETSQLVWYTALSYTWGEPIFDRPLTCNGHMTAVTRNLDQALRHLRRPDSSINLWIDQLCINQNDLEEKGAQVSLMRKIYERAWSTVIWVGNQADDSDNALESMKDMNTVLQFDMDESAPGPAFFEEHNLPVPRSQAWIDIGKFLARPWFQRVWVVQEVALSSEVDVLCGHKCVSWSDISVFADTIVRQDLKQYLDSGTEAIDKAEDTGFNRIRRMDRLRNYTKTLSHAGFIGALEEGRGAKATDARDKVYALLGMSLAKIIPDYTKSLRDVYIEASATVDSARLISLLCCVDHPDVVHDLPSWVVDWSNPIRMTSLGYEAREQNVYKASRNLRILPEFAIDGNRLTMAGTLFDTISIIGETAHSLTLADLPDRSTETSRFIFKTVELANQACQHRNSTYTLFAAFWHTLVAGKDHSRRRKAPSDEYSPIFALLIDTATGRSPSFPDQPSFKRRLTLENLKVRTPSKVFRKMKVAFEAAVEGRRFGVTSQGYMGLFPQTTQMGDHVCVFLGGYIPFVVRRLVGNKFNLVGECYVHGIMDGEVMDMTQLSMQDMTLV